MTEREYLAFVEQKLGEKIEDLNQELEEGEKDVESMHDYYWENYTEMDEYGYENFDNQQALLAQINSNNTRLDLKRRYRRMQDSPYFGRVDFRYEGEESSEPHYIGIANFSERDGSMPLIFDWRAPVSGLFYDFEKGDAYYEAPRGRIEGEVTAKWQYKIKQGRLIYAVESDLKIDDDILREELSANGDVQLKNIVRTIQREQNRIIRNTSDRVLIVQGAAGSGKTSVALHRIAYLIYHDRKRLKASEILILSPNRVFSNYISHILPELGEENIKEMSFDYFAWKELKGAAADCEDYYDNLERKVRRQLEDAEGAGSVREPNTAARKFDKQSRKFAEEINGFLLMQEDELVSIHDVNFKRMQKSASELTQLFYYKFPDIPLFRRMEAVMDYVVDEAETFYGKDYDDEQKEKIRGIFEGMYETKDVYLLYSRFLKQIGLKELPDVPVEERVVPYEDVYPMLYMKYCLEGTGSRRRVRHLVIDEMQDYSYMQYLILAKLFPCQMTIVGDRCQTMDEEQHDVASFLPSVLGRDICVMSIDKSYRNPIEIAQYAQSLIGETGIENFGRHGKAPEEIPVSGKWDGVLKIREKICTEGIAARTETERNFETAAVICTTMKEAEEVFGLFKELLVKEGVDIKKYLMLLDKNSEEFRRGVVVTAFYMAKGLEFDQVFAWNHKDRQEGIFRQIRYIDATRALHELYMLEE